MRKLLFIIISFTFLFSCNEQEKSKPFHFYVATDVHMIKQRPDYTNFCFRDDILSDIKKDSTGLGKFIVVTGDMDPFKTVRKSVDHMLGKNYRFYPVLGNHDVGMTNNDYKKFPDANWGNVYDIVKYNKANLKKIVNWGPSYLSPALNNIAYLDTITGKEYDSSYDKGDIKGSKYTTYSFDEKNGHFIILDIYSGLRCFEARHNGRISNELYNWLNDDLNKTDKEHIFIFAHQPVWNTTGEGKNVLVNEAYRQYCKDSARSYGKDSLVWFNREYTKKIRSREDFWNLLKEHNVLAYFCGHTHHYAAQKYDGIWEINLEFGAWNIEGRTRYGKIFVDKDKVLLNVMGYIEEPSGFKLIDTVRLK